MARTKTTDYSDSINCPIAYTISIFEGKWKWLLIYVLSEEGTMRYGELKKCLPSITHKMLSQQLKGLEKLGLISRKVYHQIPPKVEYTLTQKGSSLLPILDLMCTWGAKHDPTWKKGLNSRQG
ncbi:MAG: helix-turn-helix transcriptional regulator [Candidatus Omnitrophica bacterium]|nr:helix-turn-helix transcriptional regulator [Candidatus Omnitrophota bacterium]